MNEARFLEEKFGGCWCGVKFCKDPAVPARRPVRPMRFCEAVAASRKGSIVLTPESLDCPGGRRSLAWNADEETIAREMAKKAGLDTAIAREVLRTTPRLEEGIDGVTVGTSETPDIVISYAQPEAAMKLLREWQRTQGRPLAVQTSVFMSVCGAVAVKAYLTGRICISFGCPDARDHGSIGRDRLVVGLPVREVHELARNLHASIAENTTEPGAF